VEVNVYLHSKGPDRVIPATICQPVEKAVGGGRVR